MSTPPLPLEGPMEQKIKFDTEKNFNIPTNEKQYNLKLAFNEKMIYFDIEKIKQFPKEEYNIFFTLEKLVKINRYFLQFENTSEVFDSLIYLIENKNVSITEEDKQMKIKIFNPSSKKEIFISIPLKEKDLKAEIKSIVPYISSLNDKINSLEKRLKENEEKIENQNNEIKILNGKINELMIIKEEFEKFKKDKNFEEENIKSIKEKITMIEEEKIKEKEKIYFKDSNIVEKEDENIILSFFDVKPKEFIKILDSKIDGDSTKIFIDKCANICPTIIFIKTKEGYRFGGYTSKIWLKDKLQNDDKCFLFSLNKKEKYKITDPTGATKYGIDYFRFGNAAIQIENGCTSNNNSYIQNNMRFKTLPNNKDINGGQRNFTVNCYEVYRINLI